MRQRLQSVDTDVGRYRIETAARDDDRAALPRRVLVAVELLQSFTAQSVLAFHNAQLYREIQQKGRELETASKHKYQFLANRSHELRNPLKAILGYT